MVKPVKLDLGCGKTIQDGHTGVDIAKHPGVKVHDLRKPWPWKSASVDEVHCRNLVNYLTAAERVHFVNELHRVLKPGARALIITPHWSSNSAYGDLAQQWPPVAEEWYFHLNAEWRAAHAYWSALYTCDFDFTCGYAMHPHLVPRNQDYQQHAIMFWKEAAQSMFATLTKRG